MLIKQSPSLLKNLADSSTFGELSGVLNKAKCATPPLFNGSEVLSSAFDKGKLFAGNLSINSSPDDEGISLPVLPSRTNLKLHNISVTHNEP